MKDIDVVPLRATHSSDPTPRHDTPPLEIARILASAATEIQQPCIGWQARQPFGQQRRSAMPSLVPASDTLHCRPFIRVDRLQDKLTCAIVSQAERSLHAASRRTMTALALVFILLGASWGTGTAWAADPPCDKYPICQTDQMCSGLESAERGRRPLDLAIRAGPAEAA